MILSIKPGRYVLAVSGGVDSMVLLDLLAKQANSQKPIANNSYKLSATGYELVVAHFNHGIRADSDKDEELVKKVGSKHDLQVEIGQAKLGVGASEDKARQARYKFLEKVRQKHDAKSIITAHHRDDLVETALLNTLRGTKRRGLTALADNPKIVRPLLKYKKKQLVKYAKSHDLKWHEDSTNKDERYLRNFLRPRIAKLPTAKLNEFSKQLEKTLRINRRIDKEIAIISQLLIKDNRIVRQDFVHLPAEIAREVMQYWLRQAGLTQADKKVIDKATVFIKTGLPGAKLPISKSIQLKNATKVSTLWKA